MIHPNRPRIKLKLTPTDKLVEIVGWGALCIMWALVILTYSKLPATIPTRFNLSGIVDGYGHKSMIWRLLSIGSMMYIGLTYLNKYPHVFNYLTQITEENAWRQYRIASKMLRFIKLIIILMNSYLCFKIIHIALGGAFALDTWILPLFLGLLFSVMVYFIVLQAIKK